MFNKKLHQLVWTIWLGQWNFLIDANFFDGSIIENEVKTRTCMERTGLTSWTQKWMIEKETKKNSEKRFESKIQIKQFQTKTKESEKLIIFFQKKNKQNSNLFTCSNYFFVCFSLLISFSLSCFRPFSFAYQLPSNTYTHFDRHHLVKNFIVLILHRFSSVYLASQCKQ